ncbi:hypothetical protein [Stenomitos frigidus]|uniref:Uncharacterized protein n=1 Tax=Stenomitos frigidus ULC18 TaxID=2107698 RepID=A0A2T1EMZ8_9CYAN|nr:hypothetical protein [Stenomitos frigidus]PSB34114.1 hypothetical protein C7B82_03195 [Stenomitos frigidus ULC18]
MNTWQAIAKISPHELVESRLQLHYAIQLLAATGAALAEALPDYSHTSLAWHSGLDVFVGAAIRATTPFQVALDPVSLTLMLLDQQSETTITLPLAGKTMVEGLHWLQQELSHLGADASKLVFLGMVQKWQF